MVPLPLTESMSVSPPSAPAIIDASESVVLVPLTNVTVNVPEPTFSDTAALLPAAKVTVRGDAVTTETGAPRMSSSPPGPPWVDGVHSAQPSRSSSVSRGCSTPLQSLSCPSQNAAPAPFVSDPPGDTRGSVSSQSSPWVPNTARL